jgi:hypothetical protein
MVYIHCVVQTDGSVRCQHLDGTWWPEVDEKEVKDETATPLTEVAVS